MTFSKRKARQAGEGPSRLRLHIDSLIRRFGAEQAAPFIAALKRAARAALRRRPKLKRPRGRYRRRGYFPGPGGGWKLRKRSTRKPHFLANPFCPTDHSLDRKWKLSPFAVRERENANRRAAA